jgi:hypothetical protein
MKVPLWIDGKRIEDALGVLACDYRSLNDGSSPMGLPFVPPLAAFEYGAV